MKRILMSCLLVLLSAGNVNATVNLGIKKAVEFVTFFVSAVDSGGIDAKPDSMHLFTYLDGGTAPVVSLRNTTYPFIGANPDILPIDTTKRFNDTN